MYLTCTKLNPQIKWWITINEPSGIASGYRTDDSGAPALNLDSPADYIVIHNLLKAHARIYRLYDQKYRCTQNGKQV